MTLGCDVINLCDITMQLLWTYSGFGGHKKPELGGDMCLYYTVSPGEAHQTH